MIIHRACDKLFHIEEKYGLYLYGSEYRNQSNRTSDIDLMLITADIEHFQLIRPEVAHELISQKPDWKDRKLDFRFIALRTDRSPKAAEVIGLAELWQSPRAPLLGEDLAPHCYRPTWDDYYLAVQGQISYWYQKIVEPPTHEVMEKFRQAGTLKPIYNLQFYLSLNELLKSHPGKYFFSSTDLTDDVFVRMKYFLRETLHYTYPDNPAQVNELHLLFSEIKQKMVK